MCRIASLLLFSTSETSITKMTINSKTFLEKRKDTLFNYPLCPCFYLYCICITVWSSNLVAFQNANVNSRMSIPCPTMTGVEQLYQLYLDQRRLHSIQLRKNGSWKIWQESEGWVQLIGANQNNTHYLVTVNQTGLYTCKVEVHNPPPYREQSLRTVLYVKGTQILTPKT